MDSNHRAFYRPDLQSGAINLSATPPKHTVRDISVHAGSMCVLKHTAESGDRAAERDRSSPRMLN